MRCPSSSVIKRFNWFDCNYICLFVDIFLCSCVIGIIARTPRQKRRSNNSKKKKQLFEHFLSKMYETKWKWKWNGQNDVQNWFTDSLKLFDGIENNSLKNILSICLIPFIQLCICQSVYLSNWSVQLLISTSIWIEFSWEKNAVNIVDLLIISTVFF